MQKNGAGRSVRTYKTLPANVAAFWQATKVSAERATLPAVSPGPS